MTKSTIFAAAAASLFMSVAAHAFEGASAPVPASVSTRAEVKAELERARLDGELDQRGEAYGSFDPSRFTSTRPRAEVRTELAAARAAGELELQRGDYHDPFRPDRMKSTTTRAAVMAEYQRARTAGELRNHGVLYGSFAPVPYMSREQIAAREAQLNQARTATRSTAKSAKTPG